MNQTDLLLFVQNLLKGGWKEKNRIVRKCTPTSGAIYLHKSHIGKKFDLYLIPVDDRPQVSDEIKKAEKGFEALKENLKTIK